MRAAPVTDSCGRYVLVEAASGAVKEMFAHGRAEGACQVSLSRSELLAVKDSAGLLVGPDGSAKQKAGAPLPAMPGTA